MKYRSLGHTGARVSEIGFGAWQIGGPLKAYFKNRGWIQHGWGATDDGDSINVIRTCAELGINFIDTAAGYGAGHSEEVVGKAMAGHRDWWIVETKGGEEFTAEGHNRKDFSKDTLLRQIDESLKRLQTEYVDVYLLHNPSVEDINRGECLEALDEIKRSGKSRFTGISLASGAVAIGQELANRQNMDVFQITLSLMESSPAEALLPVAKEAGIGIVTRCPLAAGFLSDGVDEQTQFAENDRRSWQPEASRRERADFARAMRFLEIPGRSLAQASLKYPLAFDAVSTVIPGSKNPEHVRENAQASEAPDLTPEELRRIAAITRQNEK